MLIFNITFVREYVKDGVILITFVNTQHQDADIMTKNVASHLHEHHMLKFLGEPPTGS